MPNSEKQGRHVCKIAQETPLAEAEDFLILGSAVTFVLVKLIYLILQSDLNFLRRHLPGHATREQ